MISETPNLCPSYDQLRKRVAELEERLELRRGMNDQLDGLDGRVAELENRTCGGKIITKSEPDDERGKLAATQPKKAR